MVQQRYLSILLTVIGILLKFKKEYVDIISRGCNKTLRSMRARRSPFLTKTVQGIEPRANFRSDCTSPSRSPFFWKDPIACLCFHPCNLSSFHMDGKRRSHYIGKTKCDFRL